MAHEKLLKGGLPTNTGNVASSCYTKRKLFSKKACKGKLKELATQSLMKWDFITKFFQGSVNIERTYKSCDKALEVLKNYNKNPDVFAGEKKADMDNIVKEAEDMAKKILSFKGEKNWPGVFREMHKNLATMYLEMGRYDDAREQCNQMSEYGEVGRTDSDDILQKINDREGGKKERVA